MEKLMHYVWQHRLWLQNDMTTVDGRRVQVIDPGLYNTDAGPDFFNAKILIDGQAWCGNIEMHVKASDWFRHGHQTDRAYDSIILHVVQADDARIHRPDGAEVPQLVMPCTPDFSKRYDDMVNCGGELSCRDYIDQLPPLYVTDWLSSLAYERLYAKVDHVMDINRRLGGNWAETIYVILARGLGFGTNADMFERLALATPLHTLMKHRDTVTTVEGALFGQAGFLDAPPDTSHYVQRMQQEYAFMAAKFDFKRPQGMWRMGRMRPQNFPHRRLAMLAAIVCAGFDIASRIFTVRNIDDARSLFDVELAGYWSRRYNFTSETARSVKALSDSSISLLIINVVVPVLYAYGMNFDDESLCETAVGLLHAIKAESNALVRIFESAGIGCNDAFTSQALVQLRRNYCEPRKCLYCRIGHRILASKVKPATDR